MLIFRIMFGTTQLYVFVDHTKYKPEDLPEYGRDCQERWI